MIGTQSLLVCSFSRGPQRPCSSSQDSLPGVTQGGNWSPYPFPVLVRILNSNSSRCSGSWYFGGFVCLFFLLSPRLVPSINLKLCLCVCVLFFNIYLENTERQGILLHWLGSPSVLAQGLALRLLSRCAIHSGSFYCLTHGHDVWRFTGFVEMANPWLGSLSVTKLGIL